jgi:heat shock protein HslJ
VTGLVSGCGGDEESAADASSLEGVAWVLASGVDVEGWEEVAPSATFENGRLAGSTGCNRFTTTYTVDGDALEIGQVASTRMMCPPPGDAVERDYLAALAMAADFRVEGRLLQLLTAEGTQVAKYSRASE